MTNRFPNQKTFAACDDLPVLDSTLHWNYIPSSGKVEIAFRKSGLSGSRSSWIGRAINPTSTGMVGSQALIAFQRSDGRVSAYTSPLTSYGAQLQEGNLSLSVFDISASYENDEMFIFATVQLPYNTSVVNHVWQEGKVSGDVPAMHELSGPNLRSFGTVDFLSGKVEESKRDSRATMKNVHGIINAASWGFLMPLGAIIARHVKVFEAADPAWFYLHVTCQFSGYLVGVVGWGTGLWLGAKSAGIENSGHRCIGITIFALATIQALVGGFLRPKKEHEYRVFWNVFHYAFGYATIGLGVFNVYKGLDILEPGKFWRDAYTGIIVSLGCVAVVLEAFTWYVVLRRKSQRSDKNLEQQTSGSIVVSPEESV
ncbi:Auxin-induced in root cultures protein 12 [Morus notabilis]|uniref:Auxin-induced in root cultures protein 12 n=1 Tax=Morus notabilis TaxID=981085 RepID=W9QUI0_9ROSA|nr:cytochrome b561 and DOMON domain-containing protein At5g47530 [Morus notabilis]EXB38718.1 Auxin-induced in root cultures protein 12 [Morus notabilis]